MENAADKEMTKIVIKKCGCKKEIQIFTNESANIVDVRCPECFNIWKEKNKRTMG